MSDFRGKRVFITGAGSGIGQACAKAFAMSGAFVGIADINVDMALETLSEIISLGGAGCALKLDVVDPVQVEAAFDEFERQSSGAADTLVNSAGVLITGPALEYSLHDWNRSLAINVTGTFLCAQRAARAMVLADGGSIINLSSISGERAGIGRIAYGTSKAAVSALSRQLALELGPKGVRCNSIAPGALDTRMTSLVYNEETRSFLENEIPLRRLGTAEDIAAVALFLASDEADYIHGENLTVDGGFKSVGISFASRKRSGEGVSCRT